MGCRSFREVIVGCDTKVDTLYGKKTYVFFDNAASTPALKAVIERLQEFLPYYSNVHRGTGYKSFVSTEIFEEVREKVRNFISAPEDEYAVIFVKNTTEAINKLANKLSGVLKGKVLISEMEHHSNMLPWFKNFEVEVVRVKEDGRVDLDQMEEKLKRGDIALVAITGASNVTGFVNPVYEIAEMAHRHGALVSIDGAQFIPHKPFRMTGLKGNEDYADFLAFSAHKMYAPFGTGVLVARKDFFNEGEPESVGGGTVKFVTLENVIWADLPEREEAGTPNIIGAVALGAAIDFLQKLSMKEIEAHERELSSLLYEGLKNIEGIQLLGGDRTEEDLPVFSFVHNKISHYLLASRLSYEEGIGVRTGCFCAQPYVKKLLGVTEEEAKIYEGYAIRGEREKLPGAVRVSLGFYNCADEVERFLQALERITKEDPEVPYRYDPELENYVPENYSFVFPVGLSGGKES